MSPKSTKLSIREDEAATLSSTQHGHNLDTIGFNLSFLDHHDPRLAHEVVKLYQLAKALDTNVAGTVSHNARSPHDPPGVDD